MGRRTGVSFLGVTFKKAALGPQQAQIILDITTATSFVARLIVRVILMLRAALMDAVILLNVDHLSELPQELCHVYF